MSSDEENAYLAFDLGASSSRAVLGRLKNGVMTMHDVHRFPTPIITSGDRLQWDVEVMWSELQAALDRALANGPSLKSLSVDSWAVDYVRLDAGGVPMSNPYCYRDPRTDGIMEQAFETLSAREIFAITGIQFLPFNTLYQVLSPTVDDESRDRRAALHLPIADYFNYRFCGREAVDVSMASTTQMMDVHTRDWSMAIMGAFGIDVRTWPEIVACGTRLGAVDAAGGVEVVATCSHDTGCAVAAAPAEAAMEGWAYISCGTWSLMGVERGEPILTDEAREAGFTNEAGLDGSIRFLKNLTGLWALQECMREWRTDGPISWDELEKEAGEARHRLRQEGMRSPVIDLEDRRFAARGEMEGRIRAWCVERGLGAPRTRGETALAVLVSIADSYRRTLIDLEAITRTPLKRIHLFGGGSDNEFLCRLTAAATRREVVAGPAEATALGNLLIQARTAGDLPTGARIHEIAAQSSRLRRYSPDAERY